VSDAAAQALGQYKGKWLSLGGLTSLSVAAAQAELLDNRSSVIYKNKPAFSVFGERYAHLSDTHLRSEVEKVAVFGKAEVRSIADKATVGGESKTAGAEIEKSAKVEPHQAELAGTVTGTVTGLTR